MSIHVACLENNLSLLKQNTSNNKKVDINALDEDNRTPLFCASLSGSLECLEYLLNFEGIDKKIKSDGIPPIHVAGMNNHYDCVKKMVEYGIDINEVDNNNETLLHKACKEGNKPLVLLLLDFKDININSLDKNSCTPLHNATNFGSGTIVQALVRKGASLDILNSDGQSPLHIAIDHSNFKIVNYLIKKGANSNLIDNRGSSALHIASWTGDREIFDLILEKNTLDIDSQDSDGMTCLALASEQGHSDIVRKLLNKNASFVPDLSGETPIHKASISSHLNTLETLLQNQTKNNQWSVDFEDTKKCTALLHASAVGSLDCMKLLLKYGANISHTDDEGSNALHKASSKGHNNVVLYLIKNSELLNKSNNKGRSPLHFSAFNGKSEIIDILCQNGADVKAKDDLGRTVLHYAVMSGKLECIKVLLKYHTSKDELSERDNDGFNALHLAISIGNINVVRFMLDLENTPFEVNEEVTPNLTPFLLSLKSKQLEMSKVLLSYGATYHLDNDFVDNLKDIDPQFLKILSKDKDLIINKNQKGLHKLLKRASQKARSNVKRNESTSSDIVVKKKAMDEDKLTDSESVKQSDDEGSKPLSQTNVIKRPKATSFTFHTVSIRSRSKRRATILKTPDIDDCIEKFNESPQKGIESLIEKEIIKDDPSAIARFLFERDDIDKTKLGIFLSEGESFNNNILDSFVSLMEFTNMEFDMALRRYLTKFRLPGEAQKIDRLMEKFAERYFELNPEVGPFKSKDSVYILSFSVIMLNTDAHNPAIKKQNKMTKKQFINNNSGINDGDDFPEKFLSDLYDKIVTYEIKMESDDHEYLHADLKGWLSIQGSGVKTWKKRWFVLADNCLLYFKSTVDKDPVGIIPLENLIIQQCEGKKKFLFEMRNINEGPIKASIRKSSGFVVADHEMYTFQASTQEQMNIWIDSLNRNIFRNPFNQLMAMKKKELENKNVVVTTPTRTLRKSKPSKLE